MRKTRGLRSSGALATAALLLNARGQGGEEVSGSGSGVGSFLVYVCEKVAPSNSFAPE